MIASNLYSFLLRQRENFIVRAALHYLIAAIEVNAMDPFSLIASAKATQG